MKPLIISIFLNIGLIIVMLAWEYYFNHPKPETFDEIYDRIQCEKRGEWFCWFCKIIKDGCT